MAVCDKALASWLSRASSAMIPYGVLPDRHDFYGAPVEHSPSFTVHLQSLAQRTASLHKHLPPTRYPRQTTVCLYVLRWPAGSIVYPTSPHPEHTFTLWHSHQKCAYGRRHTETLMSNYLYQANLIDTSKHLWRKCSRFFFKTVDRLRYGNSLRYTKRRTSNETREEELNFSAVDLQHTSSFTWRHYKVVPIHGCKSRMTLLSYQELAVRTSLIHLASPIGTVYHSNATKV